MNHDYAHCLDYTKDCPKECFRAELQRDIEENRSEFVGVPLAYAHLRGTDECKLAKDKDVTCKMSFETDCIGRQSAIEEIARWIGYLDEDMILRIQIGLKKLPSAQRCINPNVSGCVGHWVWEKPSDDCRCSNCGNIADQKYPYCPWCGARMEGEEG